MRYAIVINLDYDSNPEPFNHTLWTHVRDRMLEAGFRVEGRLFTIEMDPQEACNIARHVINEINQDPFMEGHDIYAYLKEFYGYNHSETVNLLLPPSDNIQIEEA